MSTNTDNIYSLQKEKSNFSFCKEMRVHVQQHIEAEQPQQQQRLPYLNPRTPAQEILYTLANSCITAMRTRRKGHVYIY